jgi:exopolysaccharide biosynthesis polyprenyl glycosylphosphotransferase
MTPPPVATHAAQPGTITLRPVPPVQVDTSSIALRLLHTRAWPRMRFLLDALVLYLAASAALFAAGPVRSITANHVLAACFPVVVLGILHARRSPDDRLYGSLLDTSAHVIGVVSLAAMLTIALESILGSAHPLGLAIRLWLFSVVYLGVARAVLLSVRRHAVRSEAFATPTLIVGAGVVGEHLVKRLLGEPRYGLRPVGFLDSDPLPRSDHGAGSPVPVLGGPDDLASAIEQTGARQVILAFSSEPDHVLVEKVNECQQLGVEVALVPRLYEAINERSTLDHIGGLPLVSLRPTNPRGWQFAVKHAVDRSFAGLVLLVMAPVMITIAAAVRLTSPGPVLFRQRRVGRDGRVFDVLKFRTMRKPKHNLDFVLPKGCAPGGVEGVDRRTPVGRFLRDASLDELPQFINVLRGDMSLVGPRPERPEFVKRFAEEVDRYDDRHRVKSGITGWAQVNGLRGQTSIADRVEWDNYYIRNWSLRLDLRIAALTVAEVLRFRG